MLSKNKWSKLVKILVARSKICQNFYYDVNIGQNYGFLVKITNFLSIFGCLRSKLVEILVLEGQLGHQKTIGLLFISYWTVKTEPVYYTGNFYARLLKIVSFF